LFGSIVCFFGSDGRAAHPAATQTADLGFGQTNAALVAPRSRVPHLFAGTDGDFVGDFGHSFVMAAALNRFHSSGEMVGAFTVVLLGGAGGLGSFGLGALSDQLGTQTSVGVVGNDRRIVVVAGVGGTH
jgi:hypothetical protein